LQTTDEKEAQACVDALEAGGQAAADELTVEGYARGPWLTMRKKQREFAWKNDLSVLKHHVFPTFGARPLRWLATDDGERAVLSWLLELPEHRVKRDGTPLGTHTIWNTASTIRVMVRDAKTCKHNAR